MPNSTKKCLTKSEILKMGPDYMLKGELKLEILLMDDAPNLCCMLTGELELEIRLMDDAPNLCCMLTGELELEIRLIDNDLL